VGKAFCLREEYDIAELHKRNRHTSELKVECKTSTRQGGGGGGGRIFSSLTATFMTIYTKPFPTLF